MAYGVTIKVDVDENAGRKLRHDFLVIGYGQHPLVTAAPGFTTITEYGIGGLLPANSGLSRSEAHCRMPYSCHWGAC